MIGNEDIKAELRRTGSTSQKFGLSLVVDYGDSIQYYNLLNNDGSREFPPIKHVSADSIYGTGDTQSFGHCKSINDLTHNGYVAGECLSAYQGFRLDQKIGNVQILSLATLNASSSTFVDGGESWTDVKATIPAVSGATGYYFIPLACNFGVVTKVAVSARNVTCEALNVTDTTHSCGITGLVIAYKTV